MATLVVDNFRGAYTTYLYGDINSGRSYEQTSSGANPFITPGQLTWSQSAIQIDPNATVITDLIMAGKERVESGILYVYAIGHTGRVYKIQVNAPGSYNPDYDNPVLLTTITINSPTFTRGGFIDFFGATEKLYIGHDVGLTKLNFDGSGEAFVGVVGSWTQNVPRALKQFVGKLYIGNGSNLTEIDSTETITTYTKLQPGFPTNSQVRDIDVSPDGNYLHTVVSRLPLYDVTSATQQTISTANSESYIFKWNGSDLGYTAFTTFPAFSLDANIMFQNYQYTFGTDLFGSSVYNPSEKIISFSEVQSPLPNAVASTGNMVLWMVPTYFNGVLEVDLNAWGSNDFEVGHPVGFWDLFFMNATTPETDIIRAPFMMLVSNTGFGSSSNGYPSNIFGSSKIYFSTLETSSAPTTKYRFYKWELATSTLQSPAITNALPVGYYQTQSQMFSKKVKPTQVRIYAQPWVANNSFTIDLIGSSGTAIPGGSETFTAGVNLTIGDDYAWYTPQTAPTYSLGLGITNLGTANNVINKIEIDYADAGQ